MASPTRVGFCSAFLFIVLMAFLGGSLAAETSRHHLDFQIGAVIDSRLLDFSVSFPEDPTYATLSIGYCYSFTKLFSLGCWIGAMYNVPPPIIGGIKLVVGNIDQLAFSLNIGIVPSIGIYFRHFICNLMVGLIETDNVYNSRTMELESKTYIRPYLECGYSLKL